VLARLNRRTAVALLTVPAKTGRIATRLVGSAENLGLFLKPGMYIASLLEQDQQEPLSETTHE
jgi:hypothetical protein